MRRSRPVSHDWDYVSYETFALVLSPYGHSEVKLKSKDEMELKASSGLFIGSEPLGHDPERRMKDKHDDDSTDKGDDDSGDGEDKADDDDSTDGQDADGTDGTDGDTHDADGKD